MKVKNYLLVLLLSICGQLAFAQSGKMQKRADVTDPVTLCKIRYYYYPSLEAYLDKDTGIYFIKDDGEWITSVEIPAERRGGYSVYSKESVPIRDYDDSDPTQFIERHKKQFPAKTIKSVRVTASLN